MSLPRELFLDGSGSLQARPARELDGARREVLLDRLVHGRGTAGLALPARAGGATEISLTPVGRDVTAVGLRLAGPDGADVQIQVTAAGVEITEGGRRLTQAAPPPGALAEPPGQVRVYYDGGILEVFGPPAAAAAVICRRDAGYDRIEAEISARPGAPPGRASLTAWSTGRAPAAERPAKPRAAERPAKPRAAERPAEPRAAEPPGSAGDPGSRMTATTGPGPGITSSSTGR